MGIKCGTKKNPTRLTKKTVPLADKTNSFGADGFLTSSSPLSSVNPRESKSRDENSAFAKVKTLMDMAGNSSMRQSEELPNKENLSKVGVGADIFFGKKKKPQPLSDNRSSPLKNVAQLEIETHLEGKRVTRKAISKQQVSLIPARNHRVLKEKELPNQVDAIQQTSSNLDSKRKLKSAVLESPTFHIGSRSTRQFTAKGSKAGKDKCVAEDKGLNHKVLPLKGNTLQTHLECQKEDSTDISIPEIMTLKDGLESPRNTCVKDCINPQASAGLPDNSPEKKRPITTVPCEKRTLRSRAVHNADVDKSTQQKSKSSVPRPELEGKENTRRAKPISKVNQNISNQDCNTAKMEEASHTKTALPKNAVAPGVFFGKRSRTSATSDRTSSVKVSSKSEDESSESCRKVKEKKRKRTNFHLPVYKNCQLSEEKCSSNIYNFDESSDEETSHARPKKKRNTKKNSAMKKPFCSNVPWAVAKNKRPPIPKSKKPTAFVAGPSKPKLKATVNLAAPPVMSVASNASNFQALPEKQSSSLIFPECEMHPNAVSTPVPTVQAPLFTKARMDVLSASSTTSRVSAKPTASMQKESANPQPHSTPVRPNSPMGSLNISFPSGVHDSPTFNSTPVKSTSSVPSLQRRISTRLKQVTSIENQTQSTSCLKAVISDPNIVNHSLENRPSRSAEPKSVSSQELRHSILQDHASHLFENESPHMNNSESDTSDLFDDIPRNVPIRPTRKFTIRGGSCITSLGKTTPRQEKHFEIPNLRLSACESNPHDSSSPSSLLNFSVENMFGFEDDCNDEVRVVGNPMRFPTLKPCRPKPQPSTPKLSIKEVHALLMGHKVVELDNQISNKSNLLSANPKVQTKLTDFVHVSPATRNASALVTQTPCCVTPSPVPLFGGDSPEKELPSPFIQLKRRSYDRMPCGRKIACGDELISDDEVGEISESTATDMKIQKKKVKATYRKNNKKKKVDKNDILDQWASEITSHFNEIDEIDLLTG